jgi:WbqC-like protein family
MHMTHKGQVFKTVAILQSSYIPWKGYFDLMNAVDEFILYDDVQYTRRDWRNRNRLKSPNGVCWLTIPVQVKGRYHQRIDETLVSDPAWAARHWSTLVAWYGHAPFFQRYRPVLEELYLRTTEQHLSQINRRFLDALREMLGISTRLSWSSDYPSTGDKTDRLLEICRGAGANRYLSGPSAQAYLDVDRFHNAGVDVKWMSYEGYPEYQQLHPPFDHYVSALDLLLSVGDEAPNYMLGET